MNRTEFMRVVCAGLLAFAAISVSLPGCSSEATDKSVIPDRPQEVTPGEPIPPGHEPKRTKIE